MFFQGLNLSGNIEEKKYVVNPKHRTRTPKSDCTQWIVAEPEEKRFFNNAVQANLLCEKNFYWWVEAHVTSLKPLEIGITDVNYAFIAKFRADKNNEWHGYPVTAERSPYDVPPTQILKNWRNMNLFSKKEVNDLEKGRGYVKPCA